MFLRFLLCQEIRFFVFNSPPSYPPRGERRFIWAIPGLLRQAKQSLNFFWALKLQRSLGRFSLSAVKNRPLKLQCSLGTSHFECGWDTESAEKYTYVSLEPGFQSTQIELFPGNSSVWVQKKTGHSNVNHLYTGFGPWFGPDSIYILDLGLNFGLIQSLKNWKL